MDNNELNVGENRVLKNGGIILLRKPKGDGKGESILAIYEDNFAVWDYKDGHCYSGLYFKSDDMLGLDDALKFFHEND
jgi:hypothetical protein